VHMGRGDLVTRGQIGQRQRHTLVAGHERQHALVKAPHGVAQQLREVIQVCMCEVNKFLIYIDLSTSLSPSFVRARHSTLYFQVFVSLKFVFFALRTEKQVVGICPYLIHCSLSDEEEFLI
jgi:hypothetical protein